MKKALYVLFAVLSFIALYVFMQMGFPFHLDEEVVVEVRKGQGFRQAVRSLSAAGLVRDTLLFEALGRVTGVASAIIPGEYAFSGPMTQWRVYEKLRDGEVLPSGVTIVEGDTLLDIGSKLEAEEFMSADEFDRIAHDEEFLESLEIEAPSLEGYLFPDTYRFDKGDDPKAIVSIMVSRLREVYSDELVKQTRDMGWDVHQVLTLASIIEHEAVLDEERETISAVYHNRLRRGMRLQADPTAIYGIKPLSQGVTGADVRRESPYNTYIIKGLPPGPIGSPGLSSIRAALYPKDAPYLYFVAQGDGSHKFSRTSAEHNRAVQEYRAIMRSRR